MGKRKAMGTIKKTLSLSLWLPVFYTISAEKVRLFQVIYKEDSLSLILVISTEIPALHTSKGLLLLYPIINNPICMRPHQLQLHFHFMQPRLLCNSQPEFAPAKDQFHMLLPFPVFLVRLSTPHEDFECGNSHQKALYTPCASESQHFQYCLPIL